MRFNNVLLKQLVALKTSESTPKPQFTGGFNAAGYGLNRPVSPQKVKIIDNRPIMRFLGGLKGTVAARIRPQGPEAKMVCSY